MSSALSEKATAIVAEMASLGASFTIADIGPAGETRWHWQPHPEVMRNAIRKVWATVEDRAPHPEVMRNAIRKVWATVEDRAAPGFNAAMVEAIRRHQAGGTDAVR